MSTLIAVVTAVAAALVFGISAVAEQRSTKRVKQEPTLSPRLLLDLVRQPLWLTAIGGTVAGFTLQVVALNFGSLAVVQPILVCDLIFAVLISAYLRRQWSPVMLAGVAACAAGIAGFLAVARPTGGHAHISVSVLPSLAVALAVVVAGCLVVAQRSPNLRPLALALACGVNYGVAAFLVKLVTSQAGGGFVTVLTDWPIYALAVVGPLGFLLNQNAFQQGTYLAPVQAIITAADPLISIALASLWLDVRFQSSPAEIAGEALALAVMTAGIFVTAHHAPQCMPRTLAGQALASAPA